MARLKLSELMFQNMKLTRGFILKPFAGQSNYTIQACLAEIAQWSQDY